MIHDYLRKNWKSDLTVLIVLLSICGFYFWIVSDGLAIVMSITALLIYIIIIGVDIFSHWRNNGK